MHTEAKADHFSPIIYSFDERRSCEKFHMSTLRLRKPGAANLPCIFLLQEKKFLELEPNIKEILAIREAHRRELIQVVWNSSDLLVVCSAIEEGRGLCEC